jgi:TP901 family phage tail tape measure protein
MPPSAVAQIQITASTAALPAALARAQKMFTGFAKTIGMAVPNVLGGIGGSVAHGLMHAVGFRGLDLIVQQGKEVVDFQDKLTRFGIASRIAGPALQDVGSAIRQVSSETGVNAVEVLRGARAYVDLAGASEYTNDRMRLLARSAQASGSDIGDMATVVYALQHNLNIPSSELEDTIGGLINLSKDGAVHFNQMAQELIGLSPVYAQFGIKGREGAVQLASMLEVVRTGFGTASEAATGMLRLMRSLPQHAKLFNAAGVKIFKNNKEYGDFQDLKTLPELLKLINRSSLGHNRPALIKAFGRGEAERSYQLLDKLLDEYEKLEVAGMKNGVVTQDLGTYTESAAGRIAIAMEKAKNSIAEAMTPERLERMVGVLEDLGSKVDAVATAAGKLADAWGFLYNIGRGAREIFSDIDDANPYKLEAAEASRQLKYADAHPESPGAHTDAAQRAADEDALGRSASWRMTAKRLMGMGDRATEASVRAAVIASRETYANGAPNIGAQSAGQSYLRSAPPAMVDKIIKGMADEAKILADSKGNSPYSKAAQQIADAVSRALEPTARALAEAKYRELYGREPPPPAIHLDGTKMNAGLGGSASHRRK